MCPVAWSTATSWDMVPRDILFWQLPPWFVGHFTLCKYPNNLQVTLLNLLFLHGETWLYTPIPIDFISLRSSNFPVLSTLLLILPSCFIHFDPYFFQFSPLIPCEKKINLLQISHGSTSASRGRSHWFRQQRSVAWPCQWCGGTRCGHRGWDERTVTWWECATRSAT